MTTALRARFREATWTAILEAAEQSASEDDRGSPSLQAIAERAGVAVGTIYNHFRDKQELFDALLRRRNQHLLDAIRRAEQDQVRAPIAARLDGFVRAVFSELDAHRAFFLVALDRQPALPREKGRPTAPLRQLREQTERLLRQGLLDGQLEGNAVELLADVLVSIVRGVFQFHAHRGEPCTPEAPRVVGIFLHGVMTPGR